MDKDKKIFLGILLLLFSFMLFVGMLAFREKKEEETVLTDAILFKNEYEALNNTVSEKTGGKMQELSISSTNPVQILNEEKVLQVLKNGTGILYFGFAECPWCRNLLPVLLESLERLSIKKLYYLNISTIRDTLFLDANQQVGVKEEGTTGYYKIVSLLDSVLDPYYLTTKDGEKIDTKKKRILAPTIVGVKNGQVVGIHVGTVPSQKNASDALTNEQKDELRKSLEEIIKKVYEEEPMCTEAC